MVLLTRPGDARETLEVSRVVPDPAPATMPGPDDGRRSAQDTLPIPDLRRRGRRFPTEAELARLRSRLTARKWDADVAALTRSDADRAA